MGNAQTIDSFTASLNKLKTETIDLNDHAFWSKLFCHKAYHAELFEAIMDHDIFALRARKPENLAMLVFKCIEQVHLFSKERSFWKTEGEKSVSASTALAILAKVLPHILYRLDPSDYPKNIRERFSEYSADFAMHVLVNNLMCVKEQNATVSRRALEAAEAGAGGRPSAAVAAATNNNNNNNEGDDDGPADAAPQQQQQQDDDDEEVEQTEAHLVFPYLEDTRPLGDTMMRAICAVAFVPGYTVHKDQVYDDKKERKPDECPEYPYVNHPEVVWKPGVASTAYHTGVIEHGDTVDINRQLVIRALLSACSSQAYAQNGNIPARLRYLLNDPRECPLGPMLVTSLLNEVSTYNPLGSLPYSSHFIWYRENLVAESMSLLTVLFDTSVFHQEVMVPVRKQGEQQHQQLRLISPEAAMNSHSAWSIINNITESDLERFCAGLLVLLQNNSYSRMTYLPGSQRTLVFRDECFIVLWKLLYKSKHFRRLFCKNESYCRRLVVPTVTLLVDAIEKNCRASMLQLAVMLLETLSMERDFALALNEPFVDYVPFKLPAWQGSYFDLIVYAVHQVVSCRERAALSMHHAALSTVANMAPCATSFSMLSAMKLLAIFEIFTKPQVLDGPSPPDHMLSVVLYILASAVQYQFNGAAHIAYALLRRAKLIKDVWEYVRARSAAAEDVADDDDEEEEEEEEEENDKAQHQKNKQQPAAAEGKEKKKRARFSRSVVTHIFTLKCTVEALEGSVHKKLESDPNFDVHSLLQGVTLVGKMPVPHPLLLHHVPESPEIDHWLTSVVWSTLNTRPYKFLNQGQIRLFARPQPIRTDESSTDGSSGSDSDDEGASSSAASSAAGAPPAHAPPSAAAAAVSIPERSPERQ